MSDRPDPAEFETPKDHREAMREWAKSLRKLGVDHPMQDLTKRVVAIEELVSDVKASIARTDKVTISSGTFEIKAADHLTLALSAISASRGQAVSVPLRSGEVIPEVRISEIMLIVEQLMEQGQKENPDDTSD